METNTAQFAERMESCLAKSPEELNIRKRWDDLNARMNEENKDAAPGLFQIHMGAFDDLRKNGHRVMADGKPASVLAATLDPQSRLSLACTIGRRLVSAHGGTDHGNPAIICVTDQADFLPNCAAIGLAAILQSLHPGLPGTKLVVCCSYDTFTGNGDPFGKNLKTLALCFSWAEFRVQPAEKEPPRPAEAPVLPLDRMAVLFRADGVFKIAPGRTGFSGTVLRGEIRKGDILTVTDGRGQQIFPSGVVMNLALKDRFENGKAVSETSETVTPGQHLDCLLLGAELPKGTYNGMMLCRQAPAALAAPSAPAAQEKASPETKAPEAPEPAKKGFLSGLFRRNPKNR
jgi:hypothetical protein